MPELKEMLDSYDLKRLTNVNLHKNLKTHKSSVEVDNLVGRMLTKFRNQDYVPLFRKAAWYLPEGTIINYMEKAESADTPCNYFVICLKNGLRKAREL